jgi:predicted CoA-binding protein
MIFFNIFICSVVDKLSTDSLKRFWFQASISELHTIVLTEDRVKGRHYKFVKIIYFCLLNIEQSVGIINLLREYLVLLNIEQSVGIINLLREYLVLLNIGQRVGIINLLREFFFCST